jgi:hypothetical protein
VSGLLVRGQECAVSVVGYGLAATSMFASVFSTAVVAAALIALAIASSMFALSASWATCMDVGGEHTAVVSAAMNTILVDPRQRLRIDRLSA